MTEQEQKLFIKTLFFYLKVKDYVLVNALGFAKQAVQEFRNTDQSFAKK